ncbi:NAD(P)-dependent alcohol dehydrogenase [Desertimonas flava]|uniref:NAD(P)-dependent alcohol dehydrogenase n=1 Tax=Desertimonas flava TaxID=2064846 RepID=UPI000E35707D|nr:NAD(P)-dependent alcohol dehydrogenase [Desertimonas flava]
MTTIATAAVLREPAGSFSFEEVELEGPRADEVLVRMVSTGICRTDIEFANFWPLPAVLGHEGAGIVEAVGDGVAKVAVGDRVVMSFRSCGGCRSCLQAEPAYCCHFDDYNFGGRRPDGSTAITAAGEDVNGHFLGQSAFATHAVVHHSSLVRVDDDVDLNVLGALGCGFQTGAGTVLRVLAARPGDSIVIFGAGAVGLAAVMAAAAAGCSPIVVADPIAERCELAVSLGATTGLDALSPTLADELAAIVPGGFDAAIDTTGRTSVVSLAAGALNRRGTVAVVGVGSDELVQVDWRTLLNGRTVTGVIGGNSNPDVFIPELIELHRRGQFPVDRLVQTYPFADLEQAFAATKSGAVVKAVLTF